MRKIIFCITLTVALFSLLLLTASCQRTFTMSMGGGGESYEEEGSPDQSGGFIMGPSGGIYSDGSHDHVFISITLKEPTCTEEGLQGEAKCTICQQVLRGQKVIPPRGHQEAVDPAVAPTCTEAGKTQGSHCEVCNEVLSAPQPIPPAGHTATNTDAIAPTCTEEGHTAGSYCAICKEVFSGSAIPALGHTEVIDPAVAATCTTPGKTQGKHCSVCNDTVIAQDTLPANGHREVTIPGTAATCTASGKTDGKRCLVCNYIIEEQTVLNKLGHSYSGGNCTRCGVEDPSTSGGGGGGTTSVNVAFETNSLDYTQFGMGTIIDSSIRTDGNDIIFTLTIRKGGFESAYGEFAFKWTILGDGWTKLATGVESTSTLQSGETETVTVTVRDVISSKYDSYKIRLGNPAI